jgi:integrase
LAEVAEHGAPLATKEQGADKNSTFGEFVENKYGPYILAANKAGDATLAALKAQFGHLFERSLAGLGRSDFDEFKAKRLAAGISPATVNRDMDRLKAALSTAVDWGILEHNPLRGLKRITRGIEERVRYLSPDEESAMRGALIAREDLARAKRRSGNEWREARGVPLLPEIDGYSDHLMPMALLALNTGMRRGELTELTWSDIDLPARRVTVRATSAKSGKARHIPLNEEAHDVLEAYRKQHDGKGRLFALVSVTKAWNSLMAVAGIEDFRFHDLRHTFASNLVMEGADWTAAGSVDTILS